MKDRCFQQIMAYYPGHEMVEWHAPWPGSSPYRRYEYDRIIIPYAHDLTAGKIYFNDRGVWHSEPDWSGLFSLNSIKYKRLSLGHLVNADRRLARDRGVGLD